MADCGCRRGPRRRYCEDMEALVAGGRRAWGNYAETGSEMDRRTYERATTEMQDHRAGVVRGARV